MAGRRDHFVVLTERRSFVHAHHQRNARPVNVAIEQPDSRSQMLQTTREVNRQRGLADAPFAAGHGHDPADAGNFVLLRPRTLSAGLRTGRLFHIDVHRGHSRQPAQRMFTFRFDLLRDLGAGSGQLHRDTDCPVPGRHFLHQSKGNDVA